MSEQSLTSLVFGAVDAFDIIKNRHRLLEIACESQTSDMQLLVTVYLNESSVQLRELENYLKAIQAMLHGEIGRTVAN